MHVAFSALLAEGRPFLGTFIQSAAPEFVEAAGYAGFRFLTVDLEHTYYGENCGDGPGRGSGGPVRPGLRDTILMYQKCREIMGQVLEPGAI